MVTLVRNLRHQYDISVGFLKEKGYLGESLNNEGIKTTRFTSPWQIASYLKENTVDIIHTFLYRANIFGRIAGRLARTHAVISTQQAIDIWKPGYLVWIDRLTFRWCNLVIVNSKSAKDSVQRREKFASEKVAVVSNGINLESFSAKRSKEEIRKNLNLDLQVPIIISVARLHREKGMDFLPEIAAKVNQGIFLVVGEGIERRNMEHKIRKIGLQKRFKFLGWRQDIPELLKASDIFLMPSREESFPQAILEAMALELPVVVSDIGGVSELIEDKINGILVKSGDINSFALALNYLSDNSDKARLMGKNGYAKAANFTEKNMVESVNSLYQQLLKRNAK